MLLMLLSGCGKQAGVDAKISDSLVDSEQSDESDAAPAAADSLPTTEPESNLGDEPEEEEEIIVDIVDDYLVEVEEDEVFVIN